jgi:hypothetical protein
MCLLGLAPTTAVGSTTLATNPAGAEVLLHQPLQQQSRPLFVSTREPDGSFAPLRPLGAPPGVFDAQAALDDAGGAVAAWVSRDPKAARADRGFVSVRAPGAAFAPPTQVFEEPPGRRVQLAANGAGDAIVGWSSKTDGYVFRPSGGAFGQARTLPTSSLAPTTYGFFSGLSVDPDGAAHVFSELQANDGSSDLYEAIRPRDGEFGAAAPIAHLARSDGVAFAASRTGRVLFVWNDGTTLKGMDRAPGGSFSAPFDVPAGPISSDIEDTPAVLRLAVAPSGAAVVAIRARIGVHVVAARKAGGSFSLSAPVGSEPSVGVDNAGDAAAVWSTRAHAVRAMYRSSDQPRFDSSITLAAARPFAPGFESPSVAIADSGRASAAWEQDDGATIRVVARDFRGSRAGRREVVGSLPSFVREGPPSACRPAGARVVRSGPQSTVFVSDTYYGCLLARGAPARLTNFSLEPGPPSTMSLAGPLVAYAGQAELRIVDLRDPESGVNRVGELDAVGHGAAFLAASRLKANGSAAWIACARNGKPGESRSRCVHKGGMTKHVFAWVRSAFVPRLLDSGRGIDPGSFKLRGSALSWRHGGRLRHARLR